MSRLDKLKEKFLNPTSTITYNEVAQLLKWLNFIEDNKGKTSGSRVCFFRVVDGVYLLVNDFDECNDELEQSIVITLFPYLQNYIKIITSLSDMPPISLPYPIGSK